MDLLENKKKEYMKRLLLSRMRILVNHGFYGLLLMHMKFAIDEQCKTASTDGVRIYFGPKFLEELNDAELDFVMMHEILHVVLQHSLRKNDREKERFNIACDIVVNSNILLSENMRHSAITLGKWGESMHLAPSGIEGYKYTAEQVYEMLPSRINTITPNGDRDKPKIMEKEEQGSSWDDHTKWGKLEDDETLRALWRNRLKDACEAISVRDPSNQCGLLPRFAERLLKELRKPQTNWRMILNEFVQEEIADYSFAPPDRRFDDSPFFLPDFNDKEDLVEDILFMIDTSGSMSDDMITAAYSEVKGAIDQFDGKLKGWLGFFDATIVEPKPFSNESNFTVIRPKGGGGTNFDIIFEYVHQQMTDKLPASIIILTDGYASFPEEAMAGNIPVLWLLNNNSIEPPWGKIARISV